MAEAETLLILAGELKYLDQEQAAELLGQADELGRMLSWPQKSLQARRRPSGE